MSVKEKPKKDGLVPVVVKSATDLQRLKLEKLMKNPNKPVIIPDRPKQKGLLSTPDFVRNVMGSSAGAGSGEFHVYRHLRRKEYARQKYIQEKSEKELLDEEYHKKIEDNKKAAEERTAKKRAKRLKKKAKLKQNKNKKVDTKSIVSSQSESSSEEENYTDDKEKESKVEITKDKNEQEGNRQNQALYESNKDNSNERTEPVENS